MLMLVSVTACGGVTQGPGGDDFDEEINTEQTQIYVYNYDGGYKTNWLRKAKARYEELHKDDTHWEEGKKGVQIMITPAKTSIDANSIKNGTYEIYFTESVDYYSYVNKGAFLDISEVYTADNPYEPDKKIFDKLTDKQQYYYNIDNHYYALPGYAGYFGIVYNIDEFDKKGYYIKKDADFSGSLQNCFTRNKNEMSAGPDGIPGNSDDGLPVTYDEFFALCKYMKRQNTTPIIWSGQYYAKHLTGLLHALAAQAAGEDEMWRTYTNSGDAQSLGRIVDGSFVKDEQPLEILNTNGYELARRKGNYDALTFIEDLIKGRDGETYFHEKSFDGTVSHTNAQETFLKAGDADPTQNTIGMLVDGVWWESEATDVFAGLVQSNGDAQSRLNRKFGWMPLPKASYDDNGITLIDSMYSSVFVKSTLEEWKKPLIIDFLQFLHTDESLREFTVTTSTPKAFKYSLTDDDRKEMSAYGISLFELYQKANVIYPLSKNSVFLNNQSIFRDTATGGLYQAIVNRSTQSNPAVAFKDYPDQYSAENYFTGLYEFMKSMSIWK